MGNVSRCRAVKSGNRVDVVFVESDLKEITTKWRGILAENLRKDLDTRLRGEEKKPDFQGKVHDRRCFEDGIEHGQGKKQEFEDVSSYELGGNDFYFVLSIVGTEQGKEKRLAFVIDPASASLLRQQLVDIENE